MTFHQAGNDKELKVTLAFSIPFPYTEADTKSLIPEDKIKNRQLKSEK